MNELQKAIAALTQEQLDILRTILPGVTLPLLQAFARMPLMQLALRFLLYERQEETAMRAMVEGLITERHAKHHNAETHWWTCGNQVCVNAKLLLDDAKRQSVEINSFAVQLMSRYDVKFDAIGDQDTKTLVSIKMQLVDKLTPGGTEATDPTKQQSSGLILP